MTAFTSALFALPFAVLFTLLTLHIEPPLGPLKPLVNAPPDRPNVGGTAVVLGTLLLAIGGLALDLRAVLGARRSENGTAVDRLTIAVGVMISLFIAGFVISVVVDQYPCWIGVPNCD